MQPFRKFGVLNERLPIHPDPLLLTPLYWIADCVLEGLMTAFFFGGVCLGFSAGFFIMALLISAHKSDEAMELQEFLDHRRAVVEPFISWRVTGQGNIPDTIAIDMNEEGEIYVRTGQFHWEE